MGNYEDGCIPVLATLKFLKPLELGLLFSKKGKPFIIPIPSAIMNSQEWRCIFAPDCRNYIV